MKLHYLTPAFHHVYMAIICSVNFFLAALSVYFQIRELKLIFYGIGISVLIFYIGILRVQQEIHRRRPYSNMFITILDYICCFVLSCVAIYALAKIDNFVGVVVLSIVILIEVAIIPIISYRYKIRNKIIAYFKKLKQKNKS